MFNRVLITPLENIWMSQIMLQKQQWVDALQKECSWKCRNIHRKITVLETLFNKVADLRAQVFACKYYKIFKNFFSYRTPPVTASAVQKEKRTMQ